MKVLLPTSCFLPRLGGVEVGLHNIAKRLHARGHTPVLVVPFGSFLKLRLRCYRFPYRILPLPPKIEWFLTGRGQRLFFLLEWYLLLLQGYYRFDVWHVTVGYPIGVAAVRVASKNRIPHLVRCVGADIQVDEARQYGFRRNPEVDQLVRYWLPKADALVAISKTVEEEYRELDIDKKKITCIGNGVDLERFAKPVDRHELRKTMAIPAGTFVLLSVGRYHPKKNFETVIRVAEVLKQWNAFPFRVLIVGEGTQILKPEVQRCGLEEIVRIIVPQKSSHISDELPSDELLALYRLSDVFVFPSYIETFGIVLVEAMAAGLPIVTSDAPGCRDIIDNGRFGIMRSAADHHGIAGEIRRLYLDRSLRHRLVSLSRNRAAEFSWNEIVTRYITLYRILMTGTVDDEPTTIQQPHQ